MENIKSISFDFSQICRFCLSQGGVMSAIFDDDEESDPLSLASRIMACASVQLCRGDGLPTLICHCCLQQVEQAHQFRQQCEAADVTLREYLGIECTNFGDEEKRTKGYTTTGAGVFNMNRRNGVSPNCITEESSMHCLRLKLNGEEIMVEEKDIASVLVVIDPKVPDYDANDTLTKKNKLLLKASEGVDSEPKTKGKYCKNGRPFHCSVCTKSFSQKAHLTRHELVHSGKKPFTCTVCSKSFADSSTLTTHYRMHTGERPYSCETCSKAFMSRSDLRKHSFIHSGLRPFACPVCSKTFTRGTNLRKHARVHSGQRPYSCDQCSRTFSSKGDLARHILIHSGHRPHVCMVCCVSFSRRDKLVRHMRRHQQEDKTAHFLAGAEGDPQDPQLGVSHRVKAKDENVDANASTVSLEHRCTTCGKDFQQRRELVRHERVHSGDKPFACELCPMRFSRRDKLTRHGKVHLARRPETQLLRCDHCPASFYRKDKLLRHRRTHLAKSFPCGQCRVSFGSKAAYEKHVLLRHWEENCALEPDESLLELVVKEKSALQFDEDSVLMPLPTTRCQSVMQL